MSVERVNRAGGALWRVRWRDEQGRAHSRVVGRKGDAQAFDAELKRAKRLGAVAPIDTSRETVGEFAKVWWSRYVVPNLARHTQLSYASMLDVHIIPRLGDVRLRSLTPDLVAELRAEMATRQRRRRRDPQDACRPPEHARAGPPGTATASTIGATASSPTQARPLAGPASAPTTYATASSAS